MDFPILEMNLGAIEHNARTMRQLLGSMGIKITGVAKGTLANPNVVKAMILGGIDSLGDSRLDNLAAIRACGFKGERVLLRSPSPSVIPKVIELSHVSLNSSPKTVELLGKAATAAGIIHKVILMVDLGDRREGVLPEDAVRVGKAMSSVKGIILHGVGTNLACLGGVIPTEKKMLELLDIKQSLEKELRYPIDVVSGGNSANIGMAMEGEMPKGVNNLRIGEGILLGTEAVKREPISGCSQDTFKVAAEVVEVSVKPSMPSGDIGQNAFGVVPKAVDRGPRRRAICAIGRQDADPEGLTPLDDGIEVVGASSDHLILDIEDKGDRISVGSVLWFRPNYSSLLQASTSPFVQKVVKR